MSVPSLWVYGPQYKRRARRVAAKLRLHRWLVSRRPPKHPGSCLIRLDARREGDLCGRLFRLRELAYDARPIVPMCRARSSSEGRWPLVGVVSVPGPTILVRRNPFVKDGEPLHVGADGRPCKDPKDIRAIHLSPRDYDRIPTVLNAGRWAGPLVRDLVPFWDASVEEIREEIHKLLELCEKKGEP